MSTNNLVEKKEVKRSKKKIFKILLFLFLVCITGFGLVSYLNYKSIENSENSYNNNIQNIFTIPEYDNISENFKKGICQFFVDNQYLVDGSYFFTKIPNRAKNVIAYGNFSDKKIYDGLAYAHEAGFINDDIAFIIEKYDFKSSAIVIMSEGAGLLYHKEFEDELPTISSFKKGTKIYMGDSVLAKSPTDGVFIHTKYSTNALLYVPEKNIFETFYQYTKEDLENQESEMEEYYEEENDSITNESSEAIAVNDTVK